MKQMQMEKEILAHFQYEPTTDQLSLIKELVRFVEREDQASLFLLKGYAGTGKTTIISSLVKMLGQLSAKPVLLAPTGRAAKVLAAYSGEQAYTIHKKIYRVQTRPDGTIEMALQTNKYKNTLFLVDEASMISYGKETGQGNLFGSANLLDDLVKYIYSGRNCRLILIGDTAQLPPVHLSESPALNPLWLKNKYHLSIYTFEMRQVVRQSSESGILYNATLLRNMLLQNNNTHPAFKTEGFPDFIRLNHETAGEQIMQSFNRNNLQDSLVICRSNKRANLFNHNIRQRVLFMEEEINSGDMLMVVKNNYYWLNESDDAGFLANGDLLSINRIQRNEHLYGFRFSDIQASMIDYHDQPELDVKIMLDTLNTNEAALNEGDYRRLFDAISEDYQDLPDKRSRMNKIKANEYYQALQVKFGYALTCHKSQGGQWRHVFIDMGYMPGMTADKEYFRWLYTAITRAREKVFLMNFPDSFFSD